MSSSQPTTTLRSIYSRELTTESRFRFQLSLLACLNHLDRLRKVAGQPFREKRVGDDQLGVRTLKGKMPMHQSNREILA